MSESDYSVRITYVFRRHAWIAGKYTFHVALCFRIHWNVIGYFHMCEVYTDDYISARCLGQILACLYLIRCVNVLSSSLHAFCVARHRFILGITTIMHSDTYGPRNELQTICMFVWMVCFRLQACQRSTNQATFAYQLHGTTTLYQWHWNVYSTLNITITISWGAVYQFASGISECLT